MRISNRFDWGSWEVGFVLVAGTPDEPITRKPDVTFARLTLGFEPRVPLDEGLAETVDWFRRGIVEPAMRPRGEGPAAMVRTG